MEKWIDIFGYEGRYEVSNLGNMRTKFRHSHHVRGNRITGRFHYVQPIKPKITWDGYHEATLINDNGRKYKRVHIIVWESFNKKLRPKGLVTNHIDGNKLNNNINNLEVVTVKENTIHAFKNNLMKSAKGEQLSKLKNKQVKDIRKRYNLGESQIKLAKKYKVGKNCIWNIVHRNTWRHI